MKRRSTRLKGLEQAVPVIEAVPDPPLPPLPAPHMARRSFVRRHGTPVLAIAAVIVGLVITLPFVIGHASSSGIAENSVSVPPSFNGLVRLDPGTGNVVNRVLLPGDLGEAYWTFASGSIWKAGSTGIDRVNPKTGQVEARIPTTGGGAGIAGSEREGIWFTTHAQATQPTIQTSTDGKKQYEALRPNILTDKLWLFCVGGETLHGIYE